MLQRLKENWLPSGLGGSKNSHCEGYNIQTSSLQGLSEKITVTTRYDSPDGLSHLE